MNFKKLLRKILWRYNFYINRFEVLLKRTHFVSSPLKIIIEPTSDCNFSCIYCNRTNFIKEHKTTYLSKEDFNLLLSDLTPKTLVYLSGIGSSFLHPDMLYFAEEVKKKGCFLGFWTNGALETPEIIDKLYNIGIDMIDFSIPALQPSIFRELRNGDINIVKDNISYYASKKNRGRLNFSVLIFNGYEEETDKVLRFAAEIGVDSIDLQIPQIFISKNKYLFPLDLNKRIEASLSLANKLGLEIHIDPPLQKQRRCEEILEGFMVLSSGEIVSCWPEKFFLGYLKDFYKKNPDNSKDMNNKNIIKNIWNSQKFAKLREINYSRIICPNCIIINPSLDNFRNSESVHRKDMVKDF